MSVEVLQIGRLAPQETSAQIEFVVPLLAETMFIRIVALFRDNEPLGGDAPTFQIKAGSDGLFTSIDAQSGEVEIAAPGGVGGAIATLRCKRDPLDIFLISIALHQENVSPWRIRIRNNDAETLTFLGFVSDSEEETHRPWMVLGESRTFEFGVSFGPARTAGLSVRNLGTAPLEFRDTAGPIGAPDGGFRIAALPEPNPLPPHGLSRLVFETERDIATLDDFQLNTNDPEPTHGIGSFRAAILPPPPPPPPPPPVDFDSPCRSCDCEGFVGVGLECLRPTCRHPERDHPVH